jgi:hypothetical protein
MAAHAEGAITAVACCKVFKTSSADFNREAAP